MQSLIQPPEVVATAAGLQIAEAAASDAIAIIV